MKRQDNRETSGYLLTFKPNRGCTMLSKCRSFFILLLIVASDSFAVTDVKPMKSLTEIFLNLDGTYSKTIEVETKILSRNGLIKNSLFIFEFAPSYETVAILEASIKKPGGEQVSIAIDDRAITPERLKIREIEFGFQIRAKSVFFPNLQVGDTVQYKIRKTMLKPNLLGHFFFDSTFTTPTLPASYELTITSPKKLKIYSENTNFYETVEKRDGEHIKYTWQPALVLAARSIERNYSLAISTIKDYKEFANIFAGLTKNQVKVTPSVMKIVGELTINRSDDTTTTKLIYEWIQKNITYKPPGIGIDLITPSNADTILARGYGDCKDFAVLFESMTKAAGIESSMVLISLNVDTNLSRLPTAGGINHVITYLPKLGLYADSTSTGAPFGKLPLLERNRPALHVKNFSAYQKTQNY